MWYGWQILIPGAIGDGLVLGGVPLLLFSAPAAIGAWIAAVGLHAFSGPIVHLTHGQPGKAALSFLVDGIVPGGVLTAILVPALRSNGELNTILVLVVFPFTWVGGLAFDSAFLARKEVKPKPENGPAISLAPLVVPKVHPNSSAPVGLSLVGRF